MKTELAFVFGLLCLSLQPATAQAACETRPPLAVFRSHLPHPDGAVGIVLDHADSQAFLAAFNATPPETSIESDQVFLHRIPDAANALIALVVDGCVQAYQFAPLHLVRQWMLGIVPTDNAGRSSAGPTGPRTARGGA